MSGSAELSALGGGSTRYHYDAPDIAILEAFDNPRPGREYVIALDCLEFTSLCPVTAQPDYGRIYIQYVAGDRCVESKSLKLYLGAYRNHGAFHEDCVNTIADHLVALLDPLYLRVFGDFHARGGIAIRPLALIMREGLEADVVQRVQSTVDSYDAMMARFQGR